MENLQRRAKQIIIVRTDLVMPMGKLGAQISHASLAPILNQMRASYKIEDSETGDIYTERTLKVIEESALQRWIDGQFVKILLAAKNENKLKELIPLLKDRNIPHALITDCGYTVFTEPTVTCLGIGPCWPEEIDDLTKKFQTLKTYKFE